MFALVDANSFYASAEEVFDPSLRGKPIVVLTNNDGCICAMSAAAKKLDIKSFSPYFMVKDKLEQSGAIVRSSNYALYADLSSRVFEVTGRYAKQHIYSVDEAFLKFSDNQHNGDNFYNLAKEIQNTVWQETRIPVGVGIGPTPTLAKAASFAGKRFAEFDGIAVLDTQEQINYVLKNMLCGDIWGVGKRIAARLQKMGIYSALALAHYSPSLIRQSFSVELERTVRELNGTVCFNWQEIKADKQQIFASRSFGQKVTCLETLQQAAVHHAMRVGKKLRGQRSLVDTLCVSAQSSPQQANHYKRSVLHKFTTPTNDDREIASAATAAIVKIFKPEIRFLKCSVGAIEIVPEKSLQYGLFAENNRNSKLMQCLDAINTKFGNHTLKVARLNTSDEKWRMNRDFLSPQYTTKWKDIPVFKC